MTKRPGRIAASLYRIVRLVRKEFWQYRADKVFTALLVGLPLLLLLLVVNAISGRGGEGNPIVVLDQDQSAASRQIIAAIENTGEVRIGKQLTRLADGDTELLNGTADGMLVIPKGLQADLASGQQAEVWIIADGSDVWAASNILSSVAGAVNGFVQKNAAAYGASEGLQLRPTRYFEILRVQDAIPAQMGFLLYMVVLIVAGLAMARECETGTLEQLLVTPLNRFELIFGKSFPAIILGVIEFWLLYAAGRIFWDVPVRGSIWLLFAISILFVLSESAWGLFLSSRVTKQQQAVMLVFIQVLFDISFCGYMVPVHNLPNFLIWLSELLPLRHYLECVRGVLLKGSDASMLAWHIGALVVQNVVFWTLSVRSLHQRLR